MVKYLKSLTGVSRHCGFESRPPRQKSPISFGIFWVLFGPGTSQVPRRDLSPELYELELANRILCTTQTIGLGCPDFDGGRILDFAAIIVRGGRDGTQGLPATR